MTADLTYTYAEAIECCTDREIAQLVEIHTAGIVHFKMLMRRGATHMEGISLQTRIESTEKMLAIANLEAEKRGMERIDPRLN
jgi:hypothetical protein